MSNHDFQSVVVTMRGSCFNSSLGPHLSFCHYCYLKMLLRDKIQRFVKNSNLSPGKCTSLFMIMLVSIWSFELQ